jgi:lipopolysaccharide transport system ATP-binding protein
MSETVIRVENLSKKYMIGHQKQERYVALRDVLTDSVKSFAQKILHPRQKVEDPAYEEFWALKDVSFEIKQGDRVGIIGRNGAGKSTLLKILSRITEPTSGKISIKGRVASLLEVGTGFHAELSGRENIFLNGAILGMGRAEIKKKFDEIVDFAEVEKFIDTPVKRYSSGMYVRLAFAVAAHLEPEILIVDEVLAVGDAQFQKKCLGKMEDVGRNGRTVIFVSHQTGAINQLCTKAVLLNKGSILESGEPKKVIDFYLRDLSLKVQNIGFITSESTKEMFVSKVQALNSEQEITSHFAHTDQIVIRITYKINKWNLGIHVGFFVSDQRGRRVFTTENNTLDKSTIQSGKLSVCVTIPSNFLVAGDYFFTFYISIPHVRFIDWVEDILRISIIDSGSQFLMYEGGDYGCVFANCKWQAISSNP